MSWKKINIQRENGEWVEAQAPEIVSASRSTDIPAFYADWFFHRLKVGYSAWTNPFNGVRSYVAYQNTHFIVFWSKNPYPLIKHLDYLQERNIGCYIQYSLNDYEQEHLEQGVPPLDYRIKTFQTLVDRLGKGRVIWRFDPLLLTTNINIDLLLRKIENIGDQLLGYTEKLVFSFADILLYRKVKANLDKNNIPYVDWTQNMMQEFASKLVELNKSKWNYQLATCGEKYDFKGVEHNHCIDDDLIIRLAYQDEILMDFLGVQFSKNKPIGDLFSDKTPDYILLPNGTFATHGNNQDKGQRQFCGCINSKDIGEYNTCPHLCEYCYANTSKELAQRNYKLHKNNPLTETILGK